MSKQLRVKLVQADDGIEAWVLSHVYPSNTRSQDIVQAERDKVERDKVDTTGAPGGRWVSLGGVEPGRTFLMADGRIAIKLENGEGTAHDRCVALVYGDEFDLPQAASVAEMRMFGDVDDPSARRLRLKGREVLKRLKNKEEGRP